MHGLRKRLLFCCAASKVRVYSIGNLFVLLVLPTVRSWPPLFLQKYSPNLLVWCCFPSVFGQDGVTAAEMLCFKRDLCPDLSTSAPPPSTGVTPRLKTAPSQARPPVTPRVPNPYTSGFGALVSSPRRAGTVTRRPLPASPFAAAAEAVAVKRAKMAARAAATSEVVAAPTAVVMGHAQHNTARAVLARPGAPSSVPAPSLASPRGPLGMLGGRGRVRPHEEARGDEISGASATKEPPSTSCASTAPHGAQHPQLQLRVTSSLDTDAGGQHEKKLRNGAGAGGEVISSLPSAVGNGFQTARGTPVAITAEALAKVEHLFRGDSTATPNRRMAQAGPGSAPVRLTVSGSNAPTSSFPRQRAVRGGGEDRRGLQGAPTAGKKSGHRDVAATVAGGRSAAGDDSMGVKSVSDTDMAAPLSSDSGPRKFAGFQTGRGRTLSVSSEALAKVQHLFCDDSASVSMPSASSSSNPTRTQRPRRSADDVVSRSPAVARTAGMPRERSGVTSAGPFKRPAVLSKPGCGAGEAGFRATIPHLEAQGGSGKFRNSAGRLDGRDEPAPAALSETACSDTAFQTARGKKLHVSEQAIARVSHIFSDAMPANHGCPSATSVAPARGGRSHPSRVARTMATTTMPSMTVSVSSGEGHAESRSHRALPGRGTEEMNKHGDAGGDSCNTHGGVGAGYGEMDKVGVHSVAPLENGGGGGQLKDPYWAADVPSNLPTTGSNAFQTAGGRALSVSAEALAKVSHLFEEGNAGNSTIVGASGKGTSGADRADKSPAVRSGMNSARHHGGAGSQGARAREVSVSAKAEAKVGRSLESSKSSGDHGGLKDSGTATTQRSVAEPTGGLVRPGGGGPKNSTASGGTVNEFATGFKTGRGRSLNITAEALEKTKRFFTEEGSEVERENLSRPRKDDLVTHHDAHAVAGMSFATAKQGGTREAPDGMTRGVSPMSGIKQCDGGSGGSKVDASSLANLRDPRDNAPILAAASGTGFRTGKGAPVHVSAEALKKAKHFLGCASERDVRNEVQGNGATPPQPHARESANSAMPPGGDDIGGGASMFSTAKGRVIEVSAEALAQAKHRFGETEPSGKSAPRGQRPALDSAEAAGSGGDRNGSRGGGGTFSAEVGGATELSCEALARAGKILEDVGSSSEPGETIPRPTTCFGAGAGDCGVGSRGPGKLAMETGRNMGVFAEGAQHVQGKFRGKYHSMEPAAGEAPPLVGTEEGVASGSGSGSGCDGGDNVAGLFLTGTGRTIEVSAEALAQAQRKFGETKPSTEPGTRPSKASGGENCVSAFSTGKGRTIDVSAEALALAQKRFGEMGPSGSSVEPVKKLGGRALGGGKNPSVFSTGRGRAVEVSPAALAQANKLFGDGGAAGGGSDGGDTSQAIIGGGEGITPRRRTQRVQALPQGNRELPSRDVRLPSGVGKENGEGGQLKHVVGTPARSTGVVNAIAARARHVGVSTPNHANRSGKKSMRGGASKFSPPSRRRVMAPPSGTATPSSGGKPLCRTINPAEAASIPSPIGRGTPLSSKRRGLGHGGHGPHAMKRPRSSSKPSTPGASPHASLHGLRSGGNGVFLRPSLTRRSGVLATASPSSVSSKTVDGGDRSGDGVEMSETSRLVQGEPGCGTSRVLFDSTTAAADLVVGGASKARRDNHRLPLSSLLNVPPQVAEKFRPCGVDKNDIGFTEETGGVEDGRGEERQVPSPLPKAVRTEGATVAVRLLTEEERREVAALLMRVTARNAVDLCFRTGGIPCCLGKTPAAPEVMSGAAGVGSLGPVAALAGGIAGPVGSRAVATGHIAQGEQERESCRRGHRHQASAAYDFRDDLVRSGKDGELATPTWVENHLR